MRIRTLFLICMSALTAMAGGLGFWLLAHAVSQYRFASRVEQAVEAGGLLFTAADRLSAVIPAAGGLMFDENAADAAGLQRLADARRAFEAASAQAEEQIAALSSPDVDQQLAIMHNVRASRLPWDARALEVLAKPRKERDMLFWEQYITGYDPMFDALDSVLDLGDMAAEHEDGLTMDLLDLARQAWLTRVLMADRSGPVIARMGSGRPMDVSTLERVAQANGRLAMRWTTIDVLVRRLPRLPGLNEVVIAAHATAADFDTLTSNVVAAARRGEVYPIAAKDFGNHSVAVGKSLVRIRDLALQLALSRATLMRQTAAFSVGAVALVMLLIAAGTITVLALLARRIVSPLLSMTKVVGSLAAREFDVAIPATRRSDEIGGMAVALEALRQSAIAAERAEAQISHMARHDALTGLANRLMLQDCLEQAILRTVRGQPCAVLCLDLDRFKAVNDTFGHPTGDLLLQAVAQRLRDCVREADVVSRLGGDEFTVLLTDLEAPAGAGVLAQRIIGALCEPFDLGPQTVSIGASVGIALAPQHARTPVDLLRSADTALYGAKAAGRGTFRYFEPDMDSHLQARFKMERDLRAALESDSLELFYQPMYDLERNQPCAFEALLRWRHPERGVVSAADFLLLAEETRLIVPIGAWALRQACIEAACWPDSVKVAVNLSIVQFRNSAVVQAVADALAESGLPPNRLELEITESVVLMQSAETFAALHALRDLGVTISMDDFGTGHSSLSNLRRFPFSKIKLDRMFVRDLGENEASGAVVRAVAGLGRDLGIPTTAEGVETEAQLAGLRRAGCTQAQGYLLSPPLSAPDARKLLAHSGLGQDLRPEPALGGLLRAG